MLAYIGIMELPSKVPVMVLPNGILFPQALLPLRIFEERYRTMLRDALESHRMLVIALRRPGFHQESPVSVGGLGLIRAAVTVPDGSSHLVLQGLSRVKLSRVVRYKPYRIHQVSCLQSLTRDRLAVDALAMKVLEVVSEALQEVPAFPGASPCAAFSNEQGCTHPGELGGCTELLAEVRNASQIADLVSWTLLSDLRQRQILLETLDVETRLRRLIHFLIAERRAKGKNSAP